MADYKEFLDGIDRKAYHDGEFQWEEDGYTVTRTNHYSPPGCHNSCGVLLFTKDGKLEKVEGDPLSPVANGKLCIRCLNLPESVNHPDRVKYPMRRVGKRGENTWERISWEEALQEIAAKVREIWETDGGNAIICVHGTGRNINWQVPFFGQAALKTPNITTFGFTGFSCYMPRICGAMAPMGDFPMVDASFGHADRYSSDEWTPPGVIVVWGNEPLASNADGYLGHWLIQCVQMGSKIISIDPRLTWWGVRADYWLQLRPGTDAAIACAWLNVIIEEQLYDDEFLDYWCAGFETLAESVKDKTPEWASEISGVDADLIRDSARLYATAKSAAIQWGLAFDQQMSAMALNLAACDLMAITGNVDNPGGNILVRNAFEINAGYASGENFTPAEWRAKKLNNSYALGVKGADFVAHASSDGVLKAIETGDPYPVKMMWIQSSNVLSCPGMDAPRLYESVNRIPFIVNADPYLTPSSIAFADILLPVAMSPERNSARTWWTPCRSMSKVIDYYEAKSDEDIILAMGKLLNPEIFDRWETDVDWLNWYLHDGTGSFSATTEVGEQSGYATSGKTKFTKSFDELSRQGGFEYDEFNATYYKFQKGLLRPDGSLGFGTPSGRLELAPYTYQVWGLSVTPFHTEPIESPLSTPELMDEYPLILTCGGRSYEFFHSEHRQLPTMRELHPQPLLMINPATALKYGIKDGAWVWIENDRGRFKQKAKLTPRVNEQTVHAEHGWWFPETAPEEPNLFGTFDSNPNNCTRAFETGEGGVGSSIKAMICKIYPYKEGDLLPAEQVVVRGGWNEINPGRA
ncbi:MAG: molybdopterin-dependent oxidoreductase [Coriobacteriales bacterium]|jgi:anaerobic selenocysteine-containing dehydrogenase|nr:molybdopterin-dependent oxidoreductase [Coriobacteriales bacterium]